MENQSLPIAGFKSVIMETVNGNPVTIITAETGAGKSTQVPQYLLEEGNDIVVTQPRRLAARTVAERVAYEYGCELGEIVGFRTAYERADSPATRCLFVTDGLALVRELMGAGRHQILVLDEVHEWNLNLEVLVAWVRKRLAEGANFKVVLMSATLEAEKLSNFFGGAPIISVPGRLFPVTDEKPQGRELVMDVERLLRAGRNVLVFQPGKREIGETISALENLQKTSGLNAEILPLHGELESSDQRKCFAHYARRKVVVSTNVAQTSVTIDDVDAVVDSGMERRIEVVDGVEGLYLKPISAADSSQRKGRAGRCKPGIYIDYCPVGTDRLEFPKAEILRSRLDQTVLRLAEAGFDMEELEFFHQPAKTEIHDAKRALHALGCLGEKGEVTKIGRQVAKLPVSVQFGRMLVEADRLGVVDDVLTVAAILEQGEITMRPRDKYEAPAWKKLCAGEETSDILAQLTVWKQAERMSKQEMLNNGVFAKAYFQAKEKRWHLADALRGKVRDFRSSGKRDDILRAVCAGMVNHLYQRQYGSWKNGDGQERQLAKESVVSGGDWLVGMPFDLQIKTKRGGMMTLRLVRMATKVDPAWLVEIAPQLVKIETGLSPAYDPNQDVCVSTARTNFNGQVVKEERVQTPEHEGASQELAKWLAGQAENNSRQQQARLLNVRAGETLFKVFSIAELTAWVVERLSGARRLTEIVNPEMLLLPELDPNLVGKVLTDNPDKIVVLGREVAVEYSGFSGKPTVRIDFRGDQSKDWRRLPAEGVRLPSNREVALYSAIDGHSYYVEALSSQFASKVREIFNKQQWETFVESADRPMITIPDSGNPSSQVPAVCEHQYGVCVATELPLIAFGVVAYTQANYWSSEKFEVKWFGKREEADAERTKAVDTFVLKQKELLEKIQKQAGDIREVTIDRRGQYRKPELNGQRVDSPSSYELTPDYFWSDLLDLVGEFGRGQKAFAIYRGDSPLLVYLNHEKIEKVLPQVQDLIRTLSAELTSEGKESFWRKLEEFRTKEASEARGVRNECEALEYARQETERQKIEMENRRKKDPSDVKSGMNSLGDAFSKLGL